jgi:hypothetical protein
LYSEASSPELVNEILKSSEEFVLASQPLAAER